jgi:predicted peptidase
MGVISPDLVEFKSKISSAIGGMNSSVSTITSGLQTLTSSVSSVQSNVESNYNSDNKSTVLSNLGRVSEIYSKIAATLESDLTGMISSAQDLITKIEELEKINSEIEAQQEIVNANSGSTESAAVTAKLNAQSVVISKNAEFDTKHRAALNALKALKAQDGSVAFVQEFSTSSYENMKDSLEYGTFELKTFTSSTGVEIEYYIYVPDYGTEVTDLPCMLYMHGGQTQGGNSDWSTYGLTSLIKNQEITPSGIVIMPHITNFYDFNTLKELTDYVVSQYNCDTNKISISGHSNGGIATYNMLNKYPGYFSCAIPISGTNYDSINAQSCNGVKIWAFGGTSEGGSGSCSSTTGKKAVNKINTLGGDAKFTDVPGGHSASNKDTYAKEYESPDGEMINPLEWAFAQVKA